MELVLLGVFALIFSMLFNWGSPRFMTWGQKYPQFQRLQGSYAGRTLLTGVVVFGFLVAISYAMAKVGEKPQLPG